ncbi:MAG: hypothetical protein AAB724_00895 [Patescibacteria group bacterium]
MKKFILLLVVTIFFISVFYFYLASSALEHPLGVVRLTILMLLGAYGVLAFYEALSSVPRAWKELVFCWRRRQWKRKIKAKGEKRQGTTTVVLN